MINENISPALYALIPPQSSEEASSRVSELCSSGDIHERLVYVLFHSIEQLEKAFLDCRLVLTKKKKAIENMFSRTHFMNMTVQDDLSEYYLIVNENCKEVRIINCIMTSEPKVKRETKSVSCCVCGGLMEIKK